MRLAWPYEGVTEASNSGSSRVWYDNPKFWGAIRYYHRSTIRGGAGPHVGYDLDVNDHVRILDYPRPGRNGWEIGNVEVGDEE